MAWCQTSSIVGRLPAITGSMHLWCEQGKSQFSQCVPSRSLSTSRNLQRLLVRKHSTARITAFLEDETGFPAELSTSDLSQLSFRARLESNYSSLGSSLVFPSYPIQHSPLRDDTGGPGGKGGGGNGGNGDNGGNGGGGNGGGGEAIYLLPLLTILFAAVHMLYCVVVSISSKTFDLEFCRTGLGLFTLLAATVFRVNRRTGIDAYILGLGASVGTMVWTGERCLVKRDVLPSAIVSFAAGLMAVVFTGALYHSI